jgi:hypothetical protein
LKTREFGVVLTQTKLTDKTQSIMEQQNAGAPAQRPTFLTVLCILSFIASGFAIIWSIIALLGAIAAQAIVSTTEAGLEGLQDEMAAEGIEMSDAAVTATETASMGMVWAYVIVTILATIIGLMGVIKMWKLNKSGFYLYTGASIASLVMGSIYAFSIMSVVITVAFIAMYAMNLKHMK